jgi:hypothetical protein
VADTCVERGRVQRTAGALHGGGEPLDVFAFREVDAHRGDGRPHAAEFLHGVVEFDVLGRDDQVEAVLGELFCQLTADAAGRTGDESERAEIGHGNLPADRERPRPCPGRRELMRQAGTETPTPPRVWAP